jgi:hypothetical protein
MSASSITTMDERVARNETLWSDALRPNRLLDHTLVAESETAAMRSGARRSKRC